MKLVYFAPAARDELDAAMDWYDARTPGLGLELLDEVRQAMELIGRFPATGSPIPRARSERGTLRIPIRRFPYSLIYRDRNGELEIVAVAHASRKPGYWRGR